MGDPPDEVAEENDAKELQAEIDIPIAVIAPPEDMGDDVQSRSDNGSEIFPTKLL